MTHSIELLCPCGASMKSSGYSYPSDVRKLVEHFDLTHAECYARSEGTLSLDPAEEILTFAGERVYDPNAAVRSAIEVEPPVYEYVEGSPMRPSRASLADRLMHRYKDGIILAPESALTAGADLKAGDPVVLSEEGLVVRSMTHDCPGSYDCATCYPEATTGDLG